MSTQHNWRRLEPSGNLQHEPKGEVTEKGYLYSGPPIPVKIMVYPLVARRDDRSSRPIVMESYNSFTGEQAFVELNPGMAKWLGMRLIEAGMLAETAEDGLLNE